MTENQISYAIRGAIFEVYNQVGVGLLESVYKKALKFELINQGLMVQTEVPVPFIYKGHDMNLGFRLDMLVEGKVIVEVKAIKETIPFHHMQVINYLKLSKLKLAILVNFHTDHIEQEIYRKVNQL
ncbi:MAG TPA: GxxExxY protein [Bacteroidia bacterium]